MIKLKDKEDYGVDAEMIDWFCDNGIRLEDFTNKQKIE